MDDEKIDKTIEFILNNQAQFYADLQKVQETNKEIQENQKEAAIRTNVLERVCLNIYNTSVEQGNQTVQLTEIVKQLLEAQKETDERLNAVILMAEKFFGSQNGKSEK